MPQSGQEGGIVPAKFYKIPAWVLWVVAGLVGVGAIVIAAIVFSPTMTREVRNGILWSGIILWGLFLLVLHESKAIKPYKE